MNNKHYPEEFTNFETKQRELMCACGGKWPCQQFIPGKPIKSKAKNGLTMREIRQKLDNIILSVRELDKEAKRRGW